MITFCRKSGWGTPVLLSRALGARCVTNASKIPRGTDVLVNWGNGSLPEFKGTIINSARGVRISSSKLLSFTLLRKAGIPTPEWTRDPNEAWKWHQKGHTVYGRTLDKGFGGDGILLFRGSDGDLQRPSFDNTQIKLFTKYWKPETEVRVHVAFGQVIDYVQKKRKKDIVLSEDEKAERHWIRCHTNGWIFSRGDVERNAKVCQASLDAIKAAGLDFGALDVLINRDRFAVLEINSAPGLSSETSLRLYKEAFERGL